MGILDEEVESNIANLAPICDMWDMNVKITMGKNDL